MKHTQVDFTKVQVGLILGILMATAMIPTHPIVRLVEMTMETHGSTVTMLLQNNALQLTSVFASERRKASDPTPMLETSLDTRVRPARVWVSTVSFRSRLNMNKISLIIFIIVVFLS